MSQPITMLPLDRIRTDGGTQSRARQSSEMVAEFRDALDTGEELPPVIVFRDADHFWLADGFTRYHAHQQANRKHIACHVVNGSQRDAILYAAGANHQHGQRRKPEDIRHAVRLLLEDKEWAHWSNVEIARRCKCSDYVVRDERKQLEDRLTSCARGENSGNTENEKSRTYTTKHGTVSTMRMPKRVRFDDVEEVDEPEVIEEEDQLANGSDSDDRKEDGNYDPDDIPKWEEQTKRTVAKLCRFAINLRTTPEILLARYKVR